MREYAALTILMGGLSWAAGLGAQPLAPPGLPTAGATQAPAVSGTVGLSPVDGPRTILTLEQALARALTRNPEAQTALARLERAEALVRQIRGPSLPTLTGNITYTRLDNDRVLSGRVLSNANQLNANLVLAVPLLAPKRWMDWSLAKDTVQIAKLSISEVRRTLASATARAYLAAIAQERLIEVTESARGTAEKHLRFAAQQRSGGAGTRLDELRAAQELSLAHGQLETARLGLVRAREALGVLTGSGEAVGTVAGATLPAAMHEGPHGTAPALASPGTEAARLEQRADVRTLAARRDAALRVSRSDWTLFSPTLTATLQPFYQNPATLTMPETGWQAQVLLSLPLYDGGVRYGVAAEHRAALREAEANLRAGQERARSELRVAREAVVRADATLAAVRQTAALAAESLSLADLAYREGATGNLEVVDAERRARDANIGVTVAEDAARQARLDWIIAAGRFPY